MFLFPLYYYAVFALLARNLLPVSYEGLNIRQFNNILLFLTIFVWYCDQDELYCLPEYKYVLEFLIFVCLYTTQHFNEL